MRSSAKAAKMIVKLVKSEANASGYLMVGGETISDVYLSKGWTVLGVLPGRSDREVLFVLRQDEIAATAEMIHEAAAIDTSELEEVS